MRRIVLIGGSGFVGSNLLKHIKSELTVPELDEADLTDTDSLYRTIEAGDIVVNAAGYANATDTTEKGRMLLKSINVDGMRNLATVCSAVGVGHLIHISSVAAMGRWYGEKINEEMLRIPESPYALSKRRGELILAEFMDHLPITVLRPTSVFGEGRGLANTLCKIALRGVVPLPSGGSARIPFTYVGNIARCVELSLGNPNCFGRTFIVGDEDSYRLCDIIHALARAADMKARVLPLPYAMAYAATRLAEWLASARDSAPILDRSRLNTLTKTVSYGIAAFQSATGYVPPYSLDVACQRIVADYLRQGIR